jgi:peptide deformylase
MSWKDFKKDNIEEAKKTRPWDLLNPNTVYVSDEKANERYEICLSCPELINITKQCKQCGCFMAVKTKLLEAVCPINKW